MYGIMIGGFILGNIMHLFFKGFFDIGNNNDNINLNEEKRNKND